MSISRSKSVTSLSASQADTAGPRARPKLPRHRSAVTVSAIPHFASAYTPRVEREDPFSLSGFFPTNLPALTSEPTSQHEWDWLRAEEDEVPTERFSGPVSPISESDDEWNIPTPLSPDVEDALARDAIKREDKLGILALTGKSLD